MAPYKAFYRIPYRLSLCWTKFGENHLFGAKITQETIEKIQLIKEKLKTGQDRQKNYVDQRRRPLEFEKMIRSL